MSAKPETTNAPPAADTVTIEIDGKPLTAKKGTMVIQVADENGIYIPRFCYHKKLSVAANCRMCLVEVEKAPKPLPACATPVAEGMKVFTQSAVTKTAQRGVMEFLLINHPLDCPICDQGGECELQDLAVGYGGDISRFHETKRIIKDKNLGPLIATDMTRCIHCTRCVRFGQEIAGVMELGATGRGEHMRIGTYLEHSVDSELSGNAIDLCPVGALTSKPFRYTARSWELINHESVSPHDCVGANLIVQTRDHKVMRVLPRDNEHINETWIADRDRFGYQGLNSADRLRVPMIRVKGEWQETDWTSALEFAVSGLRYVIDNHGAGEIGALAAPHCTLEEFYLLQKLVRGLGSGNVDHRLRQIDFSDDAHLPVFPCLGRSIEELEDLEAVLLIGSNVRKDQPLLGLRLRKAHAKGAAVMAVNPVDYEFSYALAHKVIATPNGMLAALGGVVKALAALRGTSLPGEAEALLAGVTPGETERAMAETLAAKDDAAVLLGPYAAAHPQSATVRVLAQLIADLSGAGLGYLPAANSVGAWFAGCLPHRGLAGAATATTGRDAFAMIKEPVKAYVLLGVEPELDTLDGGRTRAAMAGADFVVMMTPYRPGSGTDLCLDCANVLLPMAPFTETAGTFVNCEGREQRFNGVAAPLGETRPGWKILRVLGTLCELEGFAYDTIEDVRAELDADAVTPSADLTKKVFAKQLGGKEVDLSRVAEVPLYAVDGIVRRAPALQQTVDAPKVGAYLNADEAAKLGLNDGDRVRVRMIEGDAEVPLVIDARIPDGSVWVPAGYRETSALGAQGPATVSKL